LKQAVQHDVASNDAQGSDDCNDIANVTENVIHDDNDHADNKLATDDDNFRLTDDCDKLQNNKKI